LSQAIQSKSKINYNYLTIKMTQSRIDKGLIAIPRSLVDFFPNGNADIRVYLNDFSKPEVTTYSYYKGTTRENRIGGMAHWFEENNIQNGDEIVIQIIDTDKHIYRLIPENKFIVKTKTLQTKFDTSKNDDDASENIKHIGEWMNLQKRDVAIREFYRMAQETSIPKRGYVERELDRVRENVPHSSRVLLDYIYQGHCQLCDFTFLKKDMKPYYEIHHIDPLIGNHPKNLISVCANCHSQFEYANVHHEFNPDGWLTKVRFNDVPYTANQILSKINIDNIKKTYL